MRTRCKVSIIVPIYNAERYLHNSINKILNQNMDSIEIILVNDGSTDNSLSICRELENIDTRILVIDKENGGVSSARNVGLKLASGEFVGFVDPDDLVESNMYESMYINAINSSSDIVMCNYINHFGDKTIKSALEFDEGVLINNEIISRLIPNILSGKTLDSNSKIIAGTVWRLIFKRELILDNEIKFDENVPLMEDLLFVIEALLKCNRLYIDKGFYYHYIHYENTAGKKYRKNYYEISKYVNDKLSDLLSEVDCEDIILHMEFRYINTIINVISNETRKDNNKKISQKVKFINQVCNDQRLKSLINGLDYEKFTNRKRIVIKSILGNRSVLLYLYFSIINRIF